MLPPCCRTNSATAWTRPGWSRQDSSRTTPVSASSRQCFLTSVFPHVSVSSRQCFLTSVFPHATHDEDHDQNPGTGDDGLTLRSLCLLAQRLLDGLTQAFRVGAVGDLVDGTGQRHPRLLDVTLDLICLTIAGHVAFPFAGPALGAVVP